MHQDILSKIRVEKSAHQTGFAQTQPDPYVFGPTFHNKANAIFSGQGFAGEVTPNPIAVSFQLRIKLGITRVALDKRRDN